MKIQPTQSPNFGLNVTRKIRFDSDTDTDINTDVETDNEESEVTE